MSASWNDFQGVNAGYLAELWERYRRDPRSVDAETRAFFEANPGGPSKPEGPYDRPADARAAAPTTIVRAFNLAQSIRRYGHLAARIDPLGTEPMGDPLLEVSTHQITEQDLRALPPTL